MERKEYLYDYQMIVDGYLAEWGGQDCEPEILDFLAAYREGSINDIFSAVYQQPGRTREELEKFIENYIPENDAERKLIASGTIAGNCSTGSTSATRKTRGRSFWERSGKSANPNRNATSPSARCPALRNAST